jgi:hypothetical protein
MEPNEQSPQNASQVGNAETSASDKPAADEEKNELITEPKATIKIEGQEFDLDAALAQDDKTLTVVLQPHFVSIENANITRDIKDGKLTVTIVKKAQHKGR